MGGNVSIVVIKVDCKSSDGVCGGGGGGEGFCHFYFF
jgi:hypothetical protein